MTNNFYTIKKTAEFLHHSVKGNIIEECFTQEKGKLVILLNSSEDEQALEFSTLREMPYLILRKNFSKAGKNTAPLFEESWRKEILSVSIINDERAIVFKLNNGHELCFSFFSAPNCFVTNGNKIVNAFKEKESFEGKFRDELFARKSIADEQKEKVSAGEYLRQKYNHFGEIYRKEVLFRSSVDKEVTLAEDLRAAIDRSSANIINEFDSGKFLLYETGEGLIMSLIDLTHLKMQPAQRSENINTLVSTYAFSSHRKKKETDLKAVNAAPPATAAAPQAGSSNRIRVALIGDGVADKCGHFQMVAKELAGTHDVKRFIGDHSSLAAASDRYLLKQDVVAKASAHKPALVVLMAGTYDASSNRDAATTQLDKDVAEILAKLEAGESRPKLILCTPPPIRPDARDNLKEDRMADNVAPAIRFVAAAKGIPLLDYHAMLVGRSDLFAPDNGQNSPVGVAEEMAAALREALEGKVLPPPARPRVRVACIGDTLDTARSLEKFLPKALGYGYEVALFQDPATRLLQKDKTPYSRTGKLAEARENKPGLVILTIAEDLTTATTFQEVSAFDRELRMVMNDVLSWKPKPVLLLCRPAPFDGITSAPKPDPKKDDKRKGGAPAKAGTGPEVFVDRAITTFRLAKADPGRILKDEALVPKDGKGVKDYGKGYAREIAAAVKGLEGSRGKVE